MHIANPIYDVVFKYMLEDNKVAKLFLSAIIGEEIMEFEFSAQERTVEIPATKKVKKKKRREIELEDVADKDQVIAELETKLATYGTL